MYEKELQSLGLSEKEAKVYLASLDLGADTAQNLSKKAGVNRATTYVQIEVLKARGLMSEFERGKKTMYVAESPERLQGLFHETEAELTFRKSELTRILPGLQDRFSGMGERPKVRFFEGSEGIRSMREDLANNKSKKILSFVNYQKLMEYSSDDAIKYMKARIDQGVEVDVIYTSKDGPSDLMGRADQLRKAKFIPHEEFPLKADMSIYENKVVIEGYKDKLIGIIIESQEIAESMRTIFENLWKRL